MSTPQFTEHSRLDELTGELCQFRLELGELLAAEKEQRVRAWQDADTDKVSAADRYADAVTLDLTLDIIRLKAEIAAAETEWQFLMRWMEVAG